MRLAGHGNMDTDRKFHSIICDDIRMEMGDKCSLMGCYAGTLRVARFPANLPRLGVYSRIFTEQDNPIQNLRVRLFFEKKVLGDVSVKMSDINPDRLEEWLSFQVAMICGPVTFEHAGELRVEIETENEGICAERVKVFGNEDIPDKGAKH